METPVTKPDYKRERNPQTTQRHRKEVFWQISLPIAIGSLIFLVFAVLSFTLESGETSRWADISLIWLIMPVMVVTLITCVMLAASIYAIVKLIVVLPYYSLQLLNWLIMASRYVHQAGNRAVEPVLRFKSFSASARSLRRQISRK
jgi:hypothetical protein